MLDGCAEPPPRCIPSVRHCIWLIHLGVHLCVYLLLFPHPVLQHSMSSNVSLLIACPAVHTCFLIYVWFPLLGWCFISLSVYMCVYVVIFVFLYPVAASLLHIDWFSAIIYTFNTNTCHQMRGLMIQTYRYFLGWKPDSRYNVFTTKPGEFYGVLVSNRVNRHNVFTRNRANFYGVLVSNRDSRHNFFCSNRTNFKLYAS